MRTFAALCASVLLYAGLTFAQQSPPPGPDNLGSQPSTSRPGNTGTAPVDPQQNQRTTQGTGSTTGNTSNPDFAGSPTDPARGVQGQNPSSGTEAAPSAKADQFHPVPQKREKQHDNAKAGAKKPDQDTDKKPPQGTAKDGAGRDSGDNAVPLTSDPSDPSEPEVVLTPRARLLAVIKT